MSDHEALRNLTDVPKNLNEGLFAIARAIDSHTEAIDRMSENVGYIASAVSDSFTDGDKKYLIGVVQMLDCLADAVKSLKVPEEF